MSKFRRSRSFTLILGQALALACATGCAADEFDPDDASGAGGTAGSPSGSGGGWVATGGSNGTGASSGTGGSQGKKPQGVGCILATECASGFCSDGLCCSSECTGACESCGQAGSAGSCQPYATDTDPENECLGALKSTGPCSGKCDGAGACKMPGAETPCGQKSCADAKETTNACDGNGLCKVAQKSCAPFLCGFGGCATSCASELQCADSSMYCKQGACVPKLGLGSACTSSTQCTSQSCVDGACCASQACATGFSCSSGSCQCNGQTCAPSDQCVPWYEDTDGDGFGDKTKTAFGCSSIAPVVSGKKYVSNADDCFDANKQAFPGQTAFFGTQRGDGSFDYDCNATDEKKYFTVASPLCRDCHGYGPTACGLKCGDLGLKSMGLTCNLPNNCGGPKDTQAFAFEVGCGGMGDLKSCVACSTGVVVPDSLGTVQQVCR